MEYRVQKKLVVFDVEGVLIPKERFLLSVVGSLGFWPFIKSVLLRLIFEFGLISLKDALKNIYMILKGISLQQLILLFQMVPLMPGIEGVFKELKESGFRIALISSGIPTLALEKLAERLKTDFVSGLEIGLDGDLLTGEIWGDVIEPGGKAVALQRILVNLGMSSCYCGVADDRNNGSMFQLCDLKIGYNPDYVLVRKSDYAIKGELAGIIPLIKGEHDVDQRGLSKSSVIRETVHVGGFLVSLACMYLVPRLVVSSLILIVVLLYIMSETCRMFGFSLPLISDFTQQASGEQEFLEFVSSPIFFAFGIFISLMFFPMPICYVSITVLTLGDGFASIVGRRFGRHRVFFNKAKNFEGTFCGLVFAFLGSLLFVNPLRALIASVVGMFTEILPLPVNDNLTIPLTTGLVLIALSR